LLCQFKPNRTPGLSLSYCHSIHGVSVGRYVINPDSYYVTAPKLAVDCQIEQRQISRLPVILRIVRIAQTCFGLSGGFAPVNLPLACGGENFSLRWG
jgi:hypothetical protein